MRKQDLTVHVSGGLVYTARDYVDYDEYNNPRCQVCGKRYKYLGHATRHVEEKHELEEV